MYPTNYASLGPIPPHLPVVDVPSAAEIAEMDRLAEDVVPMPPRPAPAAAPAIPDMVIMPRDVVVRFCRVEDQARRTLELASLACTRGDVAEDCTALRAELRELRGELVRCAVTQATAAPAAPSTRAAA